MKTLEQCSCGTLMPFRYGPMVIDFSIRKQRPHPRLDGRDEYVGHYECTMCHKLWVTTTLKRFRRHHVV